MRGGRLAVLLLVGLAILSEAKPKRAKAPPQMPPKDASDDDTSLEENDGGASGESGESGSSGGASGSSRMIGEGGGGPMLDGVQANGGAEGSAPAPVAQGDNANGGNTGLRGKKEMESPPETDEDEKIVDEKGQEEKKPQQQQQQQQQQEQQQEQPETDPRKWKAPLMSNGMRRPHMVPRGELARQKERDENSADTEAQQQEQQEGGKVKQHMLGPEDELPNEAGPGAEDKPRPPLPAMPKMIKPLWDEAKRPVLVKKGSLGDSNANILEDNYSVTRKVPKSRDQQ